MIDPAASSSVGFSHRLQRRTADHRNVVAGELVLREKLANLELHQIQKLLVIHHVHLVHEHHDEGNPHLASQQDVLARLGHGTVRGRNHQNRAVHLRRARDHVLHVVRVTRAVNVRVVASVRLVLHVSRRDRDPALALLGGFVDRIEINALRQTAARENARKCRRQRRLPVINVTDRPHVHVRLRFARTSPSPFWPFPPGLAGRCCTENPDPVTCRLDLEATSGIEPLTYCLPCNCSTD